MKLFNGKSTIRAEYYIKHPEEFKGYFQVLCANCNTLKEMELRDRKGFEGRNKRLKEMMQDKETKRV
jgi:hypothetical protein